MSTQHSLFEEFLREQYSSEERALFALTESVDWSSCGVSVAFASQTVPGGPAILRDLDMSADLQQEFRQIAASVIVGLRNGLDKRDLEVRLFRTGTRLADHQVEWLQIDQQVRITEQLELLQVKHDVFDSDPQFRNNLRFYVISIYPADGGPPLHYFRVFSEANALGHKHRAIFLGSLSRQYQILKDPGYLIDAYVDCICHGNDMFILKKDKFQYIFHYYEVVQRDARAALRSIERRLPIANRDEFLAACDKEPLMVRKVAGFRGQPHLKRLSIKRAKRAIERFSLPIKIAVVAEQECLIYDRSYKWEFLRLLGDEYLSSPMTRLDYEADGRRLAKCQRYPLRKHSSMELVPRTA